MVDFLPENEISVLGSGIEVKVLLERLLVLSIVGHMCGRIQISLLETQLRWLSIVDRSRV